ncbi:DUF805 domain-containing protein [Snodgrassella sp. B3800]|uniref:DUF805 domain-containing protein n=1 Tax=Snodgrassella TaxID=1193515 RepID=UPI00226AC012|nr:DUF805 domain-containing protein [Snodgrassella sp. B3800]MCX8746275.1 DUF805 domain-containing protein [Snodgrassella sp. B3800]
MEWFISCMTTNYCNFQGRARRKEYWFFTLIIFLIGVLIGIIASVLGLEESTIKMIQLIWGLVLFMPALGVQVRRLHDISRSGWWILLNLIPIIGPLVIFIFNLLDSTPGDNEYGPNPKY